MIQLFLGLIAEGNTDYRFLEPIIEKTLVEIAFYCKGQIDIDVKIINCEKGSSFSDYVLNASRKAHLDYGMELLIVHTDADAFTTDAAYNNKINPAKNRLEQESDLDYCKNLVAIVPIKETEAWMLADKDLFIRTIGSDKNESELNIDGHPETFGDPKKRIEDAIQIGRYEMPRKLRHALNISDLYSYLGQAMQIENLKAFQSYLDFENNIRKELIKLNLLSPQN